jgi:hypothetical protein
MRMKGKRDGSDSLKHKQSFKSVEPAWFILRKSVKQCLHFLDCSTLMIEALVFYETSIAKYQSTRRNVPGHCNVRQHLYEYPTFRTELIFNVVHVSYVNFVEIHSGVKI